MDDTRTRIDYWFDPVCPYSWNAHCWLVEVQRKAHIDVTLHPMSLLFANEHSEESDQYKKNVARTAAPSRVAMAIFERHGGEALRQFYLAFGRPIFDHWRYASSRELRDAMVAALAEVGLPANLIEAGEDTTFDNALRRSHEEGTGPVGGRTVGTPTIHIDGAAFFGPVLQSIPRGDQSLELLEALRLLAHSDSFYELKRDRTRPPVFD
ncbi:mycothiol-dependent nitroreductase Rv2466c family protein [Gulosibacter molinativorax]|uniref:Disulfide bond formation protein DsbA n=1 Tax=Gulosibacter molinativorax TaxID=256821 RepID=A0ABT7CAX8_9MICO|nr:DsbA family protein [Gulosibacter molinativorax]MDJ1372270.1 disulfide bond formation protein DsbA [Gulosibacter molinativorax]QUY63445.1 DSBA oxidoreductase [Gulosibacter molinativorax]